MRWDVDRLLEALVPKHWSPLIVEVKVEVEVNTRVVALIEIKVQGLNEQMISGH